MSEEVAMNAQIPAAPTTGVAEILAQDQRNLEASREERNVEISDIILQELVEKVTDQAAAIEAILSSEMKTVDAMKALLTIVANEVKNVVKGYITVLDYNHRNGSRQGLFLFVGTHWVEIPAQQYFDFVRDCAYKMGLKDIIVDDEEFMAKVIGRLGWVTSKHRRNLFPKGDVWINMKNGTLEIHNDGSLSFREHRAKDFFLYCLEYSYNPNAKCKKWNKFLNEVLPDTETQQLLSEYIGYCFTRDLKLEKMAVFYGTGSNGKSVILDVIEFLFGKSNISNVPLNALTSDDEKRAQIENKLANISHESGGALDNAMMKQLVSGEPTDVRILYHGTHTMHNYAKFFTSFNKLPKTENTFGWFRRWILFPFNVTIPDDKQDPDLTKKLLKELPGILNWVLKSLKVLVKNRSFSKSDVCNHALNEYKRSSNSVLSFLDARCKTESKYKTSLKDLYNAYGMYCLDEGLNNKYRKGKFREQIENIGAVKSITNGMYMYNITIVDDGTLG